MPAEAHGVQAQTQRIDQNMPLFALDQFLPDRPVRIDVRPPFSSALLRTLLTIDDSKRWGLLLRSACSRIRRKIA